MAFGVLIVDDNRLFLETARDLLERKGLRVVGLAATAAQALQRTAELRPDIVLVDISLGDESGFDVARRLAEHDHGGAAVTVWSDNLPGDPVIGAFTVSVLRELGYRAALHMASHMAVAQAANDWRRRIQATGSEWFADYPSASDFLDLLFRCSAFRLDDPAATRNGAFFCGPAADRLMNIADREQVTNPQRAAAVWAKADRAVTDAAPWVILANLNNVDFLSARVTNYQYNPFLGVLLDQLQIRSRQPSPRQHTPQP